jgi:uncharacterized membrane protein YoaK (UPF0700 family)
VRRLRYSLAVILLAVVSGADDVFSFVALDGVFTSVMTGNLVLFGLGVGRADPFAVLTPAVSIGAFAVGAYVAAGWLRQTRGSRTDPWPRRVTVVLAYGQVAHVVVLAAWMVTDGEPGRVVRLVMLALLASAMGIQSAAVNTISVPGIATTYFTGTLTWLAAEAATDRPPATMRRRGMVLMSIVAGASLAGVLVAWAPLFIPVLPGAAMAAAIQLTIRGRGRFSWPLRSGD